MDTAKVVDIFNELPESKQMEVIDFINFLRHQEIKERILKSDKEPRLSFNNIEELMQAIDNAD
ncbi:MAG: hypothetical protein SFH39_03640 [Candidatus Magnetobacterium sp. LHC-1]|nr:hypothetical protein [Nitrospirota bacterium]